MAGTIEKPVDSGKTLSDIAINTGQICMGFKADTLRNMTVCDLRTKIWLERGTCIEWLFLTHSRAKN